MTETERAAATAWAAMNERQGGLTKMIERIAGLARGPMPPAVAIDFVQDVTGDRDEAVTALVAAGANWLDEQTRPHRGSEICDTCNEDATQATAYLRAESFGIARTFCSHIRERCEAAAIAPTTRDNFIAANKWEMWLKKATRVIKLCEQVVAEAYPEDVT